jgi:RNA polymerase sigma factor (sigma-70 family)
VATLDDMKVLYSGFDLCNPTTSVSMTINGPAPTILAMYLNAAIDQQQAKFCTDNGREPTDDELSEEIGIDRAKLSQLKVASMRPASLDAPISEDDSTEFGEIVGDENALTPFELLSHKNMHGQLDGLLTVLDARELKIIEARFGLSGQKPRTLEEVGQEFGVTRERIRQLQNLALRKLRRALQKKEDPIPKALRNAGGKKKRGKKKEQEEVEVEAETEAEEDLGGDD